LYFNSLYGDFVSDDYATIPQNPLIKDFGFMAKDTLPKFTNYLINEVFGISSPIPYHVFNLSFKVKSKEQIIGYVSLGF
jgi:hypothetical protein